MYINANFNCCGIREIVDLRRSRSPIAAMKAFVSQIYAPDPYDYRTGATWRYAVFSATGRSRYGSNFAAFIKANKLGDVIETGYNVNPNSGNQLKVWVWTVDHRAVKAWGKANGQRIADA